MKTILFGFITTTLLAMYWGNALAVPTADANGPYFGNEGSTITLDGSGSTGGSFSTSGISITTEISTMQVE